MTTQTDRFSGSPGTNRTDRWTGATGGAAYFKARYFSAQFFAADLFNADGIVASLTDRFPGAASSTVTDRY